MDFCEGHAGRLVLAAVAAACVAESGEPPLVRLARAGWRDLARQARCFVGLA